MPKILVIEDEPDQNKLIKLRLEAHGFVVLSVGKAREALAVSVREKPDLILMDMILPDLHGLDATIKLKRNPATRMIPVIGLSAVGSPEFIKACLQEGILAYIRKPYDPRELFKIIEKFVRMDEVPKKEKPGPAARPERKERERPSAAERLLKYRPLAPAFAPGPPGKNTKRQSSVEEMLRGALADMNIPGEKENSCRPKPGGRDDPSPKTVLVIDDDTAFARVVFTHLSGHGYEVNLALDGISGLKQAFLRRPDLVLLNLILPAGGGEAVLASLRKAPESGHVPVFIMSSLLSPRKLEEKARALGAQGFISKPIDPEDLLYIVESIIGA